MMRTAFIKKLMWGIVPIAFTLIFFATTEYYEGTPWISFVFLWLAYLSASVTYLHDSNNRNAILDYTIVLCGIGYFLTELFAAIIFLYVCKDIPQWSFTIQLLLFVVYVLLFGFVYITNQKTKQQIEVSKNESNVVNMWKAKVVIMQLKNPSQETKELLDILNSTPIKSNSTVTALEEEISNLIDTASSVDIVIRKIKERNMLLKQIEFE